MKPLGIKSYGSIPHLIGSRMGPSDSHIESGQAKICTEKTRDKHDVVIVQEKLDGGNVGICKINDQILAITRAGYLAESSPYKTHHQFALWVEKEKHRFDCLLHEGERVCGEWLLTAVGTKYSLPHEPFVAFDIITGKVRQPFMYMRDRLLNFDFTMPKVLHYGSSYSIDNALKAIATSGHGALETVEGAIWRVERHGKVDFLAKYVRPDKVDGKYLKEVICNDLLPEHDYLKNLSDRLEVRSIVS